ncbi:MAG TPA: alpha/beta hydrolase-fold protein [Gaiellaceae bacterium]|jgi:pimeloyl-ACP methyl ester carboxylesterase
MPPTPLDVLVPTIPYHPVWPYARTRAYTVPYLAWDDKTVREAVIVMPSGWGPNHHPRPLPLVISPHGRNNFGWTNAAHYWRELPADGPFVLVCPDGLSRAHSKATSPIDQPPPDPSLFTYGYRRWIDDLARMPKIVTATLPWLKIDLEKIYVLGSSMGGQEALLLAARYPKSLSGGTGRLAGAAAFDSTCDLATQCAYLSTRPVAHGADPPGVAARMIEEVNARPGNVQGFKKSASFFNQRLRRHMTIGELLNKVPRNKALWNERSPLSYVDTLANLPFPLRIYWSSADTVVGNQGRDQSGKLYSAIKAENSRAKVKKITGTWLHSAEFVPGSQLSDALMAFGLIADV